MKIVRLLGLALCALLITPSLSPALAASTPSVGIKEEGVKSVKAPRDVATGQSSGKRQHTPVKSNLNASKPNKGNLNSSKSNKTVKPKKAKVKSKSNITNNKAAKDKKAKELKKKQTTKPVTQKTNLNSSRSN